MAAVFDGYVRVSKVRGRGGESFISPDEQRRQIATWASLRGVEVGEFFEDLDVSGSTTAGDRPGLREAIMRVERGQSQGIIVAKLDRFARSLPSGLEAIKRIRDAGGEVVSVAEGIDPTTPAGKMLRQLLLTIAEWQLEVTKENWAAARRRAVERGVHIASRTPTGYVRGDDGRLVPHPHDGPVIQSVFGSKAAGASWADLCRLLDERGVVGPYKAAQWTQRAVSHIVANRVYLGEARHGEFVNQEAHEPLVDADTWERAQNTRSLPATRSGAPALLAGLLRCAGCRHLMKPDRQRMRDGSRARIYRCRGHHASGTCPSRAVVLGSVIEPWLVGEMFEHVRRTEVERVDTDSEIGELHAAMQDADAELAAFRDDERILSVLGPDRFVEGLTKRAARADKARAAFRHARAAAAPIGLADVEELQAAWDALEAAEQRVILGAAVDTVFLRSVGQVNVPIADRALIFWRGQAPDGLPARGRRVPFASFDWPPNGPGMTRSEDVRERAGDR